MKTLFVLMTFFALTSTQVQAGPGGGDSGGGGGGSKLIRTMFYGNDRSIENEKATALFMGDVSREWEWESDSDFVYFSEFGVGVSDGVGGESEAKAIKERNRVFQKIEI